jgi:hypothetical protein
MLEFTDEGVLRVVGDTTVVVANRRQGHGVVVASPFLGCQKDDKRGGKIPWFRVVNHATEQR